MTNERYSELAGRNVLVIDDNELLGALIRDVLSRCGAKVTVVHSGVEGLQRMQDADYELILLDLIMPGLNGWTVVEHMQHLSSNLLDRTILMTADRYNVETAKQIHALGMAVLYKPFDLDDLRVSAASVIRMADLTEQLFAA